MWVLLVGISKLNVDFFSHVYIHPFVYQNHKTKANGDMYVGEFRNDMISGFGRYYYNNGQRYEGNFYQGKRHGRGKYQYNDGRVEIFRYDADSRVGEGVRWSKDRKKTWKLKENGKVKGRISIDEAVAVAEQCGPLRGRL